MLISTLVIYVVMAAAIGIALAVGIKTLQRSKGKTSLGMSAFGAAASSTELGIVARLMEVEKQEAEEAIALATLKRVIDRATAAKKAAV